MFFEVSAHSPIAPWGAGPVIRPAIGDVRSMDAPVTIVPTKVH